MRTRSLPAPAARTAAELDHRRAWWSLASYPLAFVAAFVVGEGLASWYGYPSGSADLAPWWVALGAGGPALLVFAVPGLLAWHFGRRAVREGCRPARIPMWIGLMIPALFIAQNVLVYVVGILLG